MNALATLLPALLLTLLPGLRPDGPEDLRVGHWIEVRGDLVEPGRFVAEKVEVTDAADEEVLIGTIPSSATNPDAFRLLGQVVRVRDGVDFRGVDPRRLAGSRVKLEGKWRGPGRLSARTIASRGPGRDRIAGRVDELVRVEGGWTARVMIFEVFLADDVAFEVDGELDELELADEREILAPLDDGSADELPDLDDDDDRFGDGFALGHGLRLEVQLQLETAWEDEYDFDDTLLEDRWDSELGLRSRVLWTPDLPVFGMFELRGRQRWRWEEEDPSSDDWDGSLGETYLGWNGAFGVQGLELRVGRQDFDDPREWIYDQNLDALRLRHRGAYADVELSLSTTLADGDQRDREATNWIAYVSNGDRDRHLAAYAIHRDIDVPGAPEENLHLGVRALGDWVEDFEVWGELAHLSGERGGLDVSSHGFDVGATWTPGIAEGWSFTLGYAYGRGDDDPGDGEDNTFRQTGLQDNNGNFEGVTSFRYYGELLDPELSNLGIVTAGVGYELATRTSLDLVVHQYEQDFALPFTAADDLRAVPNGLDRDLGWEVDLVFGCRRFQGWDWEVVAAYFAPGDAYEGTDDAFLGRVQLRYRP